jgi:hypothetical protein
MKKIEFNKTFNFGKISYNGDKKLKQGGYKYCSAWLYSKIEQRDLNRILEILDVDIYKRFSILKQNKII